MGSADEGSRGSGTRTYVHSKDPPQETDSGKQPATSSGRGGSHRGSERHNPAQVAIVSIDNQGNTQFQEWVDHAEVAEVTASGKFAYYQGAKGNDETGKIPVEYRGHLAFQAKHMEGLLEHGPWDHEIKLKEGA